MEKDLDAVMLIYNLIEYSGSCSRTFENLRQYHRMSHMLL